MPPRKVYFNGEFVSEQEARVSIFDSALMFGDMVFEMTRTYGQKPFRLRAHLERMYAGLKCLGIDCGLSLPEMEQATLRTFEMNLAALDGADVQIMHNVSRGPLSMYKSVFGGSPRPTVTINCWPYWWHLAGYGPQYRAGVRTVVPAQRSVPAHLIDPKVKNRSRIHYQVANLQAQRIEAGAWAVLTDGEGVITEGTGANFFIVRHGRVFTPRRNILLGVTRGAVLELLQKLEIPASEEDFGVYEVMNSDEAFFTGTSFAIMPATQIDGHRIGSGEPGGITKRLIAAWSEMVGVDIVAQADAYAIKVKEMEMESAAAGR
jgi:branched-chain amino acid aminotransferase